MGLFIWTHAQFTDRQKLPGSADDGAAAVQAPPVPLAQVVAVALSNLLVFAGFVSLEATLPIALAQYYGLDASQIVYYWVH